MEFIPDALAQAAGGPLPNPQAAFDQTTAWYLNQGALGATIVILLIFLCVAGWVIRGLYGDVKACNATNLADRDRIISAQQAAAAAAEKLSGILEGIKSYLATHKDASEDLTKQIELAQQETRHALNGIQTSLNGISGRMEREAENRQRDAADRGRR